MLREAITTSSASPFRCRCTHNRRLWPLIEAHTLRTGHTKHQERPPASPYPRPKTKFPLHGCQGEISSLQERLDLVPLFTLLPETPHPRCWPVANRRRTPMARQPTRTTSIGSFLNQSRTLRRIATARFKANHFMIPAGECTSTSYRVLAAQRALGAAHQSTVTVTGSMTIIAVAEHSMLHVPCLLGKIFGPLKRLRFGSSRTGRSGGRCIFLGCTTLQTGLRNDCALYQG
jgi:hypothetical protein